MAAKTRAPGFRSSAAKPGNNVGSSDRSAAVTSDLGDELRELRVGESVLFDREGLDMPIMDPPLVWVELLRAHFEDSIEQLIKSDNAPAQRTLAVAHLDGWQGCAEHHPTGGPSDLARSRGCQRRTAL